ncbi:MAG: hypothetical protein ACOYY2_14120, partial [Actinomycetota bacterium]
LPVRGMAVAALALAALAALVALVTVLLVRHDRTARLLAEERATGQELRVQLAELRGELATLGGFVQAQQGDLEHLTGVLGTPPVLGSWLRLPEPAARPPSFPAASGPQPQEPTGDGSSEAVRPPAGSSTAPPAGSSTAPPAGSSTGTLDLAALRRELAREWSHLAAARTRRQH